MMVNWFQYWYQYKYDNKKEILCKSKRCSIIQGDQTSEGIFISIPSSKNAQNYCPSGKVDGQMWYSNSFSHSTKCCLYIFEVFCSLGFLMFCIKLHVGPSTVGFSYSNKVSLVFPSFVYLLATKPMAN